MEKVRLRKGEKEEKKSDRSTKTKSSSCPPSYSVKVVVVAGTALLVVLYVVHVIDSTRYSAKEGGEAAVVLTKKGAVRGVRERSELNRPFYAFYGIPYARPPLGPLRFQDPIEGEAWEGVKEGNWRPPPCVQMSFSSAKTKDNLTKDDVLGSEDCLYLKLFPPVVGGVGAGVLVYLHGGGYLSGSVDSSSPYDLLNERVVLVVLQFRIGTLGFLSTEDEAAPGNVGLKDQTLALRWVQNNILHFGGDPTRVTLFGESSGSTSTHLHVLSPMSAGLFSRVILHSGTALTPFALGGRHREVALETGRALGCPDTSHSATIIACLQDAPVSSLASIPAKYYEWFVMPTLLAPRVDGHFLPAEPHVLLKEGRHNQVDLITGIMAHDGALLTHYLYLQERLREQLVTNFSHVGPISLFLFDKDPEAAIASAIFNYWLGGVVVDEANSDNVTKLFTDYIFGVPSDLSAQLHTRNTQRKVYQFELTHRGQYSMADPLRPTVGKHWVTHTDDLIYLFQGGPSQSRLQLTHPDDLHLGALMTKMWTNFAATGDPTPDDSLGFKWEEATEGQLQHLALQPSPLMRPDQRQEVRQFLRSILPQHCLLEA